MGCPRKPHSPLTGSYWPASNPESPRPEFGKRNLQFFAGKWKRKPNPKPKPKAWLPSACTGSVQVSPSQSILLELLIGQGRYYVNQGAVRAQRGSSDLL